VLPLAEADVRDESLDPSVVHGGGHFRVLPC
jgi:hypothetical protein